MQSVTCYLFCGSILHAKTNFGTIFSIVSFKKLKHWFTELEKCLSSILTWVHKFLSKMLCAPLGKEAVGSMQDSLEIPPKCFSQKFCCSTYLCFVYLAFFFFCLNVTPAPKVEIKRDSRQIEIQTCFPFQILPNVNNFKSSCLPFNILLSYICYSN